jgi:hypothetical protein
MNHLAHRWNAATARSAPRSRRAARRGVAAVLLVVMPVTGCYTARPVQSTPVPGSTLLLDLTDRGRAELGPQLGASAERIQGSLQSVSDSGYALRVTSVRYQNGQMQDWTGETFTVPTQYIARARRQEFSRSRTLAIAAGITAALVAVLVKADLLGGGSGTHRTDGPPPGTGGS